MRFLQILPSTNAGISLDLLYKWYSISMKDTILTHTNFQMAKKPLRRFMMLADASQQILVEWFHNAWNPQIFHGFSESFKWRLWASAV